MLTDLLLRELTRLKEDIVVRHEMARPLGKPQRASGKTRDSFAVRPTGKYGAALECPDYAPALERGRGPGKTPYDFKEILRRWAAAKRITFASETDFARWAFFVSKKIREEGTALYRAGGGEDVFRPR
jgi:hypothetical protein